MIPLDEERLIARGLGSSGALLLVKRQLGSIRARRLRVIVSSADTAGELVELFNALGIRTETDTAGDDYHVVADLSTRQGS